MGKKVLIVDDAMFMRHTLKRIVSEAGYQVAGEADNGRAGVEQYKVLRPDAVLMDITMPDMDGLEALQRIKAEDPNAVVIMCTALGQESMVMEALKFGAKDYIVKPFQPDRVLQGLSRAIGS
ncbi:MAG: response regulator [Armatimonadota bacterium]